MRKTILFTLLIELMAVIVAFRLSPDAPAVFHIILLGMITIVSICFGICFHHEITKEEN